MAPAAHRQLHLLVLLLDVEGPPALDALLLEDVDHGHGHVRSQHAQRAQLGALGAAREPVQVQRDGAWKWERQIKIF